MATVVYDAICRAMPEFVRGDGMVKSCLSWWFPKIQSAGLPVPKTKLLRCDSASAASLYRHFDGKPVGVHGSDFIGFVEAAVREMGLPCFLRTGQTSGKHSWKRTCHIQDASEVGQHVLDLVEFSECADFLGLPWDVWAVREMLPTRPVCTLPEYGDMPLCREFRCFVDGGQLLCCHFYWPFFRPLMSRVIETAGFSDKLKSLYKRNRIDNSSSIADNDPSIPQSLLACLGTIHDVTLPSDFFHELHNQFGLPSFESEIRDQRVAYLGAFYGRNSPVPQHLSAFTGRWNPLYGWTTKCVEQKLNSFELNLFDLNEAGEVRVLCPLGVLSPNGKAAIGVQEASAVRKDGWFVFHGFYDISGGGCTQVISTFFEECPIGLGGAIRWRDEIQSIARLTSTEFDCISKLARRAGAACGGRWSVDILDTTKGWFVTDMAVAELSWHWPNCPNATAS